MEEIILEEESQQSMDFNISRSAITGIPMDDRRFWSSILVTSQG